MNLRERLLIQQIVMNIEPPQFNKDLLMIAEQPISKSLEQETADLLWEAVVSGATLKQIQGVPDSVMESIYAHAYKFYQIGHLDNAETFFRFLILYDTYNPEYLMGLAATLQQKKQYQNAIDAYQSVLVLAANDYRPMLHIGQCYLFMKNKTQARESFMALIESDAPATLRAQAEAYLGTMKPAEITESTETSENSHD